MKKFLAIDTETGGLDPESTSLLTIGLVLFEADRENFVVLKEHQFHIEQDLYHVTTGALKVNGLDVTNLPGPAVPRDEVKNYLMYFCGTRFSHRSPMVVAHNWAFDKGFLDTLNPNPIKFLGYRYCDTLSMLTVLKVAGKIEKCSLKAGCEFFGIEYGSQAHDALYDAKLTSELFWELMKLQLKGIDN